MTFGELSFEIRRQLKQWPVFGETAWDDLNDESPFLTIHAPEQICTSPQNLIDQTAT